MDPIIIYNFPLFWFNLIAAITVSFAIGLKLGMYVTSKTFNAILEERRKKLEKHLNKNRSPAGKTATEIWDQNFEHGLSPYDLWIRQGNTGTPLDFAKAMFEKPPPVKPKSRGLWP